LEPAALEGKAGVRKLIEVDEHIAVREPCEMVMRHFLQHPSHFIACARGTTVAPQSACQIHARMCKIGRTDQHPLQHRDALGNFVLVQ